ncbi:MAG: hypothetical protein ACOC0P_06910 [Planctomycetota bacterium]
MLSGETVVQASQNRVKDDADDGQSSHREHQTAGFVLKPPDG